MATGKSYIPKEIKEAIKKLLRGKIRLGTESLDKLNKWYDNHEKHPIENKNVNKFREEKESLLKRILLQIDEQEKNRRPLPNAYPNKLKDRQQTRSKRPNKLVLVSLFLLLISGLLLPFILTNRHADKEVKEAQWTVYQNPNGQKSKVRLPDGSTIILNAGSKVKYKTGFGKHHRELTLNGQAFFQVAKDSIPFRVTSRGMVTQALGTSFDIMAFKDQAPRVRLATGKVMVYHNSEQKDNLVLIPGEEALLEIDGLVKKSFDRSKAFGWKDGIIYYKNEPLSKVLKCLERWYGVNITVIGKDIDQKSISGEFKDFILEDILESLSYTCGFEYQINGKEVTLTFKNQNTM